MSQLNRTEAIEKSISPPEKIINIYGGIDYKKFDKYQDPVKTKMDLGINDNTKVVGMVARLVQQKAPQDFIQAIPNVLKNISNVSFFIIGDGKMRDGLEDLSHQLQITEHVNFLGFRKDISTILMMCDVFVSTSLWEGLSRSLIESMYIGCPVVATDVGGTSELVIDGSTGILVKPKDIRAISNGIVDLLKNDEKRRKLSQEARKMVLCNFSSDKTIMHIDLLYQRILKSNKSTHKVN